MKIVIAHLYYDLLNLYGENGNVKALKKYLENQNIEVEIKYVSLFDELCFDDYDFVYIGMGTENNQKFTLEHLLNYKKDIKNYIENDGFILATGNSLELFGKYIINNLNEKYATLKIFNYYAELNDNRLVCESIVKDETLELPIIGFQNRCSNIKNNKNYWFKTIQNFKIDDNKDEYEGIHYKNFYGTYLIGPILVRNPHLLQNIANLLITSKNKDYEIKKIDFDYEFMAYNNDKELYKNKVNQ